MGTARPSVQGYLPLIIYVYSTTPAGLWGSCTGKPGCINLSICVGGDRSYGSDVSRRHVVNGKLSIGRTLSVTAFATEDFQNIHRVIGNRDVKRAAEHAFLVANRGLPCAAQYPIRRALVQD